MQIFLLCRTALSFTKKQRTSILVTTLLVTSLFAFAIPAKPIQVQAESPTTIIPYLATGYKYKIVAFDAEPGFEQAGYDDSEFSLGDAGFGTQSGTCSLNNPVDAKTPWPLNTDILLRRTFNLPAGASDLQVAVAIDNDIQVFINGKDISGGLVQHEDCPSRGSFVFSAPQSIVNEGENLLSVRARDRGVLSYVDVEVSAVTGGDGPQYDLQLFEGSSPSDGVIGLNDVVGAVASVENDADVTQITFRWIRPSAEIAREVTVPIAIPEDLFAPDEPGDWIVEADFGNGQVLQKTLSISFFVLPESPIGAIAMVAASMASLGAFLYFRMARKHGTDI
ncbi:MAG TPA: hypothetical protein VGQ03_03775 [Nitrososphaera sp.]|nr:hypothetical protein [Nitrososphaera sp.]